MADGWLCGGDPCPSCGAELDYDEYTADGEPFLIHPEPQCGWLPDGYPSTRRGWKPEPDIDWHPDAVVGAFLMEREQPVAQFDGEGRRVR